MESKRTLSEISHLFLSEVRGRQGPGAARPVRVPPPKSQDVSIDMSPEEFDAAFGDDLQLQHIESHPLDSAAPAATPQASVVLASHLGDRAGDGIRRYARSLAAKVGRVGLIEVDSGEFNLTCFESDGGEATGATVVRELDGRRMAETLAEMAVDVNRWLIYSASPRSTEARDMIKHAQHWVLLTLAGDEGIVATYRSLKGLAETGTPRFSLAVLDAEDDSQATAVFRKLDAVSRQFLGCGMESELPVYLVQNVTEHPVLLCRLENGAKPTSVPQWRIVSEFLAGATAPEQQTSRPQAETGAPMKSSASIHAAATAAPAPGRIESNIPSSPRLVMDESISEVIELSGDGAEGSILDAVIRQGGANGQWVQCPLKAPMCPKATLAIGRDHRLILLALAGKGLTELRSIGLALRWMSENRELIKMALPQLNIDANAMPNVKLLVEHTDITADALQPLLQSETVSVSIYRKLKWGQNTGLLLEAA